MSKLSEYLNKIEKKTMYECPICETLFEFLDDAEQCVKDCYDSEEGYYERELKKLGRNNIEWCASCQKTVSTNVRSKRIANRNYYEFICQECNRTLIFYEDKGGINELP